MQVTFENVISYTVRIVATWKVSICVVICEIHYGIYTINNTVYMTFEICLVVIDLQAL